MKIEGACAILIGDPVARAGFQTKPVDLLREVVGEVQCFRTPGDALDAFRADGSPLRSSRRVLLVIDQRGRDEILWTWLSLFAHLDFGPMILLVEEVDAEIERRSRALGVLRCIEDRHLARHPGLLVRAARRALALGEPVPASAAS